jgi:tight adherence protein C
MILRLLVIAVLVVLVRRAPALRRHRDARRNRRALERDLPDTIDQLLVLVRSGITPRHAVPTLASLGPPSWRIPWGSVEEALERGERFVDALDRLVDTAGPPARTIVDTLVSAELYGRPLAPTLDRLAADGQAARRRSAEASARRLPVRLSFPLVCCTLPAFLLLTIAPLIAGALSSLHTTRGRP